MHFLQRLKITSFFFKCNFSSQIDWEQRKKDDEGHDCLVSVDGVDFEIEEPFPYDKEWSKRWFSPKFNGPALRYELCVSIIGGDIVWCNGPFAAGQWSDWKIFKEGGLLSHLDENERVEADDGYLAGDPQYCKARSSIYHPEAGQSTRNTVRARQETVNKRIKQFGATSKVFRHNIRKHEIVLKSAVILTQLSINRGEKLFEIEGYGDFYESD